MKEDFCRRRRRRLFFAEAVHETAPIIASVGRASVTERNCGGDVTIGVMRRAACWLQLRPKPDRIPTFYPTPLTSPFLVSPLTLF